MCYMCVCLCVRTHACVYIINVNNNDYIKGGTEKSSTSFGAGFTQNSKDNGGGHPPVRATFKEKLMRENGKPGG